MDMTAYFLGKVASDASGGGGSVQPDYLQNNPSAKDYIKNRPFYTEITKKVDTNIIIPSQEVEGVTSDGMPEGYLGFVLEGLDSDSIKKMASIVDKGQYNLTIDETTKQITATTVPDAKGFFFGNLSLAGVGDDTGETYGGTMYVTYDVDHKEYMGNFILVLQTTETTHTIGLSHIGDVVPIIVEDTYSFENIEGNTGYYFTDIREVSFEGDNVYNLTFDGEIYEGLSWVYYEDSGLEFLGNLSIAGMGDDTGEKYCLAKIPQGGGSVALTIITSHEEGNYTFSLEKSLVKTIETIHKIDNKYLDIDIEVPYTEDAEGNVIFKKDIYVNEGSVSQSFEQIAEINEKLTEVKNTVEVLPRPLIKGLTELDGDAKGEYGLSAGSGYPNGTFAWSEGSSGAIPINIPNSMHYKLIIEKSTTIDSYIQYTVVKNFGDWTTEQHIANLNKYSFLKIKFYDEQKIYFVKRRKVTAENNVIKIQFSFLSYEDKFDISEPTSGRDIEKLMTIEALGNYSHSEGQGTKAKGHGAHSEGCETIATGDYSHTEGWRTQASGDYSHAEGAHTKAAGAYSHVQGHYNIEDIENKYVHIVGNGRSDEMRSNAHTLDWEGNAWFAGTIEAADGLILNSSTLGSSKKFIITVDDSGNLIATEMTFE